MGKKHLVFCDACDRHVAMTWNGQHWLIPDDWVELMDKDVNEKGHLCPKCNPVKRKVGKSPLRKEPKP